MEENSGVYGVRLGHEELAYMLGVLGARTLPGLEDDPLDGLDRGQREAVLGACERSLLARGLVRIDEKEAKVQVEQFTLALLGTCVYPQVTTSLAVLRKNGDVDGRYYHRRDSFTVEHSFPEPGIHEFCTAVDIESFKSRVLQALRLKNGFPPRDEPFRIPVLDMEEVLGRMRQGEWAGLARALEVAGLEEKVALKLHRLFQEAERCLLLARVHFGSRAGNATVSSIAFLDGPSGLWAFFADEKDPYLAHVQPCTKEEVEAKALEYVF